MSTVVRLLIAIIIGVIVDAIGVYICNRLGINSILGFLLGLVAGVWYFFGTDPR